MQKSDDFARYLLFLGRVLAKARVELEEGGPPEPEASESEREDDEDVARVFGEILLHYGRSDPPGPRGNIENGTLGTQEASLF